MKLFVWSNRCVWCYCDHVSSLYSQWWWRLTMLASGTTQAWTWETRDNVRDKLMCDAYWNIIMGTDKRL